MPDHDPLRLIDRAGLRTGDASGRRRFIDYCAALSAGAALGLSANSAHSSTGQPASRPSSQPPIDRAGLRAAPAHTIQLEYDGYLVTGYGSTKIASAQMAFIPRNGRYQMQLVVRSMLADLSYTSAGRVSESGLQPEKYIEKRKVAFRSARTKQVEYIVSQNPAAAGRREPGKLMVPPNTQDRLSLLIHFSLMARANPDLLTPGRQIDVPFARVNSVSLSRWSAGPVKPVSMNDDDVDAEAHQVAKIRQAQRVARVARKKASVDVSFWLSADEQRLPLILQFSENGRSLKFVARP